MKITIQDIAIIQRGAEDAATLGIAQTREPARRRDGCVALVLTTKDGKRVDVLATPEEARELGVLFIACAFGAAGAPPPTIDASTPAPAQPIILGGRA